MRVFYQLSDYVSHRKAGEDYCRCLASLGHSLVAAPERADVCVVHDEPYLLAEHMGRKPGLKDRPLAAYCVWEVQTPPRAFAAQLAPAHVVWTCSEHSASALRQAHAEVRVVPHVVERIRPTQQDTRRMAREIGFEPGECLFLTVVDGVNRRKNLPGLLRAFARLPRGAARLVVKQYRQPVDLSGLPGVVSVDRQLTDGELAALHALSGVYVSAHRAEAWGLSLSEAMCHGRPVLATGWSGNMEYMDDTCAVPLPCKLHNIPQEDLELLPPFFTADMRWAVVDEDALYRAMLDCAQGRLDPELGRRARERMEDYSPQRVARILSDRLQELREMTGAQ